MAGCTHVKSLGPVEATTPDGCAECLANGTTWVHLGCA